MTIKTTLFSLGLVAALSGCSLAPGPHLDASRMQDNLNEPTGHTRYKVHLITPAVILAQAKAAAADTQAVPNAAGESHPGLQEYRIGPMDIVGVTIWGHPELSASDGALPPQQATTNAAAGDQTNGSVSGLSGSGGNGNGAGMVRERVAADGTIFFPTLGRVAVGGKTPADAARLLASMLSDHLKNPQVDVSILQYRSQRVEITGDIKRPGTLPITDSPLSLVDAIARTGGALPDADLQRVRVTRGNKVFVLDVNAVMRHGDASQNMMLRSGDIVDVPNHNDSRVFVIGEINKPSVLFMNNGHMALADALASAGSINPTSAQPRQVLVIRRTPKDPTQPEIFRLDMTQVDALLLSTEFSLKPLDVVYVGTAPLVSLNRLLNQVLPSVESLYLISTVRP